MRKSHLRTGAASIADLLPCVLNELGIPVETTDEQQRELHEEGTCASEVCRFCAADQQRRRELMVLRDSLARQLEEVVAELEQ